MNFPFDLHRRIADKYGRTFDLKENALVFQELVEEIATLVKSGSENIAATSAKEPFGVSWMDSWVAHWVYNQALRGAEAQSKEVAEVLRSLVDLKFNERLAEMQRFIRDFPNVDEPPDAGPPEPGTPPAGPVSFVPPDAGPPEPGTPPAGPSTFFEPPDAGPPEPGTPPTGPESGFLGENPWILYWFISIKAPVLLEVIDAHMTRRLNELKSSSR